MQRPQDFHEDLTEERLNRIAEILIDTRNEAVELFDSEGGDTNWGLGCRIYDRSRSRVLDAANDHKWLDILDPSLHLIFSIGAVPVRFYRGAPDEPTPNTMAVSFPEFDQLLLAFPGEDQHIRWRFAVEAEPNGEALRVVFVGLNESEDVVCQWIRSPHDDTGYAVEVDIHERGDGVDLEQPVISLPKRNQRKTTGD